MTAPPIPPPTSEEGSHLLHPLPPEPVPAHPFPSSPLSIKPPGLHNGLPVVDILPEEFDSSSSAFRLSLVARFTAQAPSPESFGVHVNLTWGLTLKASIVSLDSRHLLLQFASDEDLATAWSSPSRVFNAVRFLMFRWSFSSHMGRDPVEVPIWIGLPGLPLPFHNPLFLPHIGHSLGHFLCLDKESKNFARPSQVRFCVAMDVSKPLPPFVWIHIAGEYRYKQRLVYESHMAFCSNCCRLGHSSAKCRKSYRQNNAAPRADDEQGPALGKEIDEQCLHATAGNSSVSRGLPSKEDSIHGDFSNQIIPDLPEDNLDATIAARMEAEPRTTKDNMVWVSSSMRGKLKGGTSLPAAPSSDNANPPSFAQIVRSGNELSATTGSLMVDGHADNAHLNITPRASPRKVVASPRMALSDLNPNAVGYSPHKTPPIGKNQRKLPSSFSAKRFEHRGSPETADDNGDSDSSHDDEVDDEDLSPAGWFKHDMDEDFSILSSNPYDHLQELGEDNPQVFQRPSKKDRKKKRQDEDRALEHRPCTRLITKTRDDFQVKKNFQSKAPRRTGFDSS